MARVTIGVVAPHTVPAVFLEPLYRIIAYTREKTGEATLSVNNSPFLDSARNTIAQEALDNNSDFLFFLDADVLAPKNIIEVLISKEKEIISGPYHYKKSPYPHLAYKKIPGKTDYSLDTGITEKKVYRVDAVGAGCLLIKRSVLEKLGQPFFDTRIGAVRAGEDICFCHRAVEKGIGIFYDNTFTGTGHFGATIAGSDYAAWKEQIRKGNVSFRLKK